MNRNQRSFAPSVLARLKQRNRDIGIDHSPMPQVSVLKGYGKISEDTMQAVQFDRKRWAEESARTIRASIVQALQNELWMHAVTGCMINEINFDWEEPTIEATDTAIIGHSHFRIL